MHSMKVLSDTLAQFKTGTYPPRTEAAE
jgi:hypothetical protein